MSFCVDTERQTIGDGGRTGAPLRARTMEEVQIELQVRHRAQPVTGLGTEEDRFRVGRLDQEAVGAMTGGAQAEHVAPALEGPFEVTVEVGYVDVQIERQPTLVPLHLQSV